MAARTMMRTAPARLACLALALAGAGACHGCDEKAGADIERVKIGGETFFLEIAADDAKRVRGLGGRDFIAPDGGMIFVFPRSERLAFVMRDCPVPIDIAFLDGSGRVLAIHAMQPEPAKHDDETDAEYERRLKQYPSRFPAQFAVETAGGRLEALGVKEGDLLKFDAAKLKRLAE